MTAFQTNGIEIDAEEFGEKTGAPLLLIRGLGSQRTASPEEFRPEHDDDQADGVIKVVAGAGLECGERVGREEVAAEVLGQFARGAADSAFPA